MDAERDALELTIALMAATFGDEGPTDMTDQTASDLNAWLESVSTREMGLASAAVIASLVALLTAATGETPREIVQRVRRSLLD